MQAAGWAGQLSPCAQVRPFSLPHAGAAALKVSGAAVVIAGSWGWGMSGGREGKKKRELGLFCGEMVISAARMELASVMFPEPWRQENPLGTSERMWLGEPGVWGSSCPPWHGPRLLSAGLFLPSQCSHPLQKLLVIPQPEPCGGCPCCQHEAPTWAGTTGLTVLVPCRCDPRNCLGLALLPPGLQHVPLLHAVRARPHSPGSGTMCFRGPAGMWLLSLGD